MKELFSIFIYIFNYLTIRFGLMSIKQNSKTSLLKSLLGFNIITTKYPIFYKIYYVVNILLFFFNMAFCIFLRLNNNFFISEIIKKTFLISCFLYFLILLTNVLNLENRKQ